MKLWIRKWIFKNKNTNDCIKNYNTNPTRNRPTGIIFYIPKLFLCAINTIHNLSASIIECLLPELYISSS